MSRRSSNVMHSGLFDKMVTLLSTGDRPSGPLKVFTVETLVPTSRADTFAFFADGRNLERLTPPWINFSIRTPLPIDMREGTLIDYEITLYGLPVPWRTRIDVWQPGVRFVDRQLAGPYLWWRHEHRFEDDGPGTRVIDHVEYLPRAAALTSRFVARDVARIFDFRQRTLEWLLHV